MQSAYKRGVTGQLHFVAKWLGCQFATILVYKGGLLYLLWPNSLILLLLLVTGSRNYHPIYIALCSEQRAIHMPYNVSTYARTDGGGDDKTL